MFKIFIEPEALKEIDEACRYYHSLPLDTERLVAKFLDDVQNSFDTLCINPYYPFVKTIFMPYLFTSDSTHICLLL